MLLHLVLESLFVLSLHHLPAWRLCCRSCLPFETLFPHSAVLCAREGPTLNSMDGKERVSSCPASGGTGCRQWGERRPATSQGERRLHLSSGSCSLPAPPAPSARGEVGLPPTAASPGVLQYPSRVSLTTVPHPPSNPFPTPSLITPSKSAIQSLQPGSLSGPQFPHL